jgi:hypothetical protein
MSLGSTVENVWRATWEALVRLNNLVAETGNSDDDLVFHVRRSENDIRAADRGRTAPTAKCDKLDSSQ